MPDDFDLNLGHDHFLRWVAQGPNGPRVGAEIFHRPAPGRRGGYGDGSLCLSIPLWDARSGYPADRLWELCGAADERLTISPSVLCDVCGDHGWVENGKWKVA